MLQFKMVVNDKNGQKKTETSKSNRHFLLNYYIQAVPKICFDF